MPRSLEYAKLFAVGLFEHMIDQVVTDVAEDTPGVNGMVTQPSMGLPPVQLPAGHLLDDMATGRADFFGSIMDPEMVRDRMTAERDLAGRFQIVDEDMVGPRLPNQVTRAEFQTVANTYSDIRLGRGDLTLDHDKEPDNGQFMADKLDDIAEIMQTKAGRELIGQLSNNTHGVDANGDPIHHHTTLQPLFDTANPGHLNDHQAYSLAVDTTAQSPDEKTGAAGAGSDVRLRANANMDVVGRDENDAVVNKSRSDVVLFHEMVHALHQTRGTADPGFVGHHSTTYTDPYLEEDKDVGAAEYQAIGLGPYARDGLTENAYRAERRGVAASGKGIAGDLLMEQRLGSVTSPSYKTLGGR